MIFSRKISLQDFIISFLYLLLLIIGVFAFLFKYPRMLYIITLGCFICFYFKIFIYIFKNKISIIDLYLLFFVFYFLVGFILFNSPFFLKSIQIFLYPKDKAVFNLLNENSLLKLNFIYNIVLLPFVIFYNKKQETYLRGLRPLFGGDNLKLQGFSGFCGRFSAYYMFFFLIPFIVYVYKISGGQYIMANDNNSVYSNILGWNSVVLSALIPFSYITESFNRRFIYTFLIIICSFGILKLGFRMHSALLLFCLLINLEMRGFRLKRTHFILILIIFVIVAFQAVLRFQNFNYTDLSAVIFTVSGEFFLSQMFFVSTALNPYDYNIGIGNYPDFLLQFLPTSIRPTSTIYQFIEYNQMYGFESAPVGGISILGQSILYMNAFFILIFIILVLYFIFFRKILEQKIPHIILAGLPISLMVLPRMEFWVLRSSLFSIGIVFTLLLVYNSYKRVKIFNLNK